MQNGWPPAIRQRNGVKRAVAVWLLIAATYLLVSSGIELFPDFVNPVISQPGHWFKSGGPNFALAIVGIIVILLYNILGLPNAIMAMILYSIFGESGIAVSAWVTLVCGLLCFAAAGWLRMLARLNH